MSSVSQADILGRHVIQPKCNSQTSLVFYTNKTRLTVKAVNKIFSVLCFGLF